MHADNKPPQDAETQAEATAEAAADQQTPADTAAQAAEAPESTGNGENDAWQELEADMLKWKELSMRTAAEMENLRKRTTREREEAIRYANQRLLEELLPVIDNFEMGMQAASEDTSSMIYIGMDMVRKQLNEFLASQGAEEIKTDGLFNPNLHDAVSQEECAKGEEGRILRVTRRGFMLRDRLLRPASVIVSKLPSDAANTSDAASDASPENGKS